MLIVPDVCRILMTPKCASTWMRETLPAAVEGMAHLDPHHAVLKDEQGRNLPTIATVRHPVSWYASYWNHRMRQGWDDTGIHEVDTDCRSTTYIEFIQQVLEQHPGWYCNYLKKWLGEESDGVLVFRYECLLVELPQRLNEVGVRFDNAMLFADPINMSDYKTLDCSLPVGLAREIVESERELVDRFYC